MRHSAFTFPILPIISLYLEGLIMCVRPLPRGPMTIERFSRPFSLLLLAGATLALASAAMAQPRPAATNPASQATLLGQYGDWGAYTASPGGRKVCFALAKPASSVDNPPNRRTAANAVYMFVSTRPDEKVANEVSLLVTGYAFKPNSE